MPPALPFPSRSGPPQSPHPISGAKWWVLHTKARQEKALAADLMELKLGHFLPLHRAVRYYGRRKCTVELPLFSGYVFLLGSPEQAILADRTGRVAQLIKVNDQARLDAELAAIRLALDRGAVLTVSGMLAEGDSVEVTAGPFKGLRGVVERVGSQNRLILGIQLINRAAVLEIDHSLLQRTDQDRPATERQVRRPRNDVTGPMGRS